MNEIQLNLARKWRAQGFDQIIGQDLSVKMLKNSLYRGYLFPVYLFWGQRGTGKTSMARVFAAAINCQGLPQFQKEPKNFIVPCMNCPSCLAMKDGKHPDFIEIDAASHTGVDNVRQIIDSAALMPISGQKKIYLIDEAHMLSKAAFNALLKILEEPPVSALFILATTDPQKIIETVRSRCFQICFKQVAAPVLVQHLNTICTQESLYADSQALSLIVQESEGSVRDAINMLEQVRFAQGRITCDTVLKVLGHIDDARLIKMLDVICCHDSSRLVSYLHEVAFEHFDAEYIWKRLVELVRLMVWSRYGLSSDLPQSTAFALNRVAKKCSIVQLTEMLDMLYAYERLFAKTTNKHLLLEMILLRICQKGDKGSEPTSNPVSQQSAAETVILDEDEESEFEEDDDESDDIDELPDDAKKSDTQTNSMQNDQWSCFVKYIEELNDPLLSSVFKHGVCRNYDQETGVLDVAFAKQFIFFQEWLSSSIASWKPVLDKAYAKQVAFNPVFTDEIAPVVVQQQVHEIEKNETRVVEKPLTQQTHNSNTHASYYQNTRAKTWHSNGAQTKRPVVDVKDVTMWPKAAMILQHFPGVVRQY
ncbi:MAG TPA: DNA polymerase III subunit gamma/tau [Candidatus Dependentiae bacterium]|nr:DNA polymerase III subunit gamma/tau [Candidatus Dependentiae bacterium]